MHNQILSMLASFEWPTSGGGRRFKRTYAARYFHRHIHTSPGFSKVGAIGMILSELHYHQLKKMVLTEKLLQMYRKKIGRA